MLRLVDAGLHSLSGMLILDQIPSDELKWDLVDLTIKKAAFKDPVYVEVITGKVYELGKSAWKSAGGAKSLDSPRRFS